MLGGQPEKSRARGGEGFAALGGVGAGADFIGRTRHVLSQTQPQPPARVKCDNLLRKAIKAFEREDMRAAALLSLDATRADPDCGQAFHMLALALERMGDLHRAFSMYERAYKLDPRDPDLYLNLGLAAWRLKLLDGAEKLFRLHIEARPQSFKGYNNLGAVLRDKGQFEDAVETLRSAIYLMPGQADLWNTLGTVVAEQGKFEEAATFYREALRLNPKFGRAEHNLGFGLDHMGKYEDALVHFDKALRLAGTKPERWETRHARAFCLAALGRIAEAWRDYEVRHEPLFRASTLFGVRAPRWNGEQLDGKSLLVVAEQGLGDEIMFAGVIPDLMARHPGTRIMIASDKRLVPLFERSFAGAVCGAYANRAHQSKILRLVPWARGERAADYYIPMGSLLPLLRPDLESFAPARAFLKPDPARVAFWRRRLAETGEGFFAGVCWRSMLLTTQRRKYYGALEAWKPLFDVPGAIFVNLQYGDCREELAHAEKILGVKIHAFDGIDLKNDLGEAAALSAACDLMVSAPTAAAALAAAVGTEVWFVTAGRVWPQLGTDRYPWYARTRVFRPERFADWNEAMAKAAAALKERLAP